MSSNLSFFNPYTKGENQVTNYCGLILKLLYNENAEAFVEVVQTFISDSNQHFDILPEFSQQKRTGQSVPDLCFSQKSFEIIFETKTTDWFYNHQLIEHIKGINKNTDYKILFLLTKEFNSDNTKLKDTSDCAEENGVICKKVTFLEYIDTLKSIIERGTYDLSKYFKQYVFDFEDFLTKEGLLDNWQNLIDVINCGGNKENIEKGFYMCPNSGGSYSHKRAKYFGAYWWRNVNYISEIKAVCVMHKDECVIKWNNTKLSDNEIINEAKGKVKDFKDWNKSDVENGEMQLFLFDKLVELKYKKITKGGMFASKRYFKTKARTIEELHKELNGKEWE